MHHGKLELDKEIIEKINNSFGPHWYLIEECNYGVSSEITGIHQKLVIKMDMLLKGPNNKLVDKVIINRYLDGKDVADVIFLDDNIEVGGRV